MSLRSAVNLAAKRMADAATRVAPAQTESPKYPDAARICPLMGAPTRALRERSVVSRGDMKRIIREATHVRDTVPMAQPRATP